MLKSVFLKIITLCHFGLVDQVGHQPKASVLTSILLIGIFSHFLYRMYYTPLSWSAPMMQCN